MRASPNQARVRAVTLSTSDVVAPVLVAVVAVLVRLRLMGGVHGLRALHGYDDGVYYAAADAFVHGRLPYRDFTLVHPPGAMLALAPFAALGRLVGDADGFVVARVAVMVVGAVNAVLVLRIASRWGRLAGLVGGGLYAVCWAAAVAERTTLLEPFGTLTLLAGMLLLIRAAERGRVALEWVGGAVVGLGATVKIWSVVPLAVVVGWQAWTRGRRVALRVLAGAAAAVLVAVGPFFAAAPGRMTRLVLLDQLGRPRYSEGIGWRLGQITGVGPTAVAAPQRLLVALVVAGVAGAAVAAWWHRRGRVWVVLLVTQVGVLIASPSYLDHYAAFSAAAGVLVVAAGVSVARRPLTAAAAAAACVALGTAVGAFATQLPTRPFPAADLRAALPATGCVQSDMPAALALVGALSRDLAEGCRVPVDVTGETYDVGARANGVPLDRAENPRWQHDAAAYLGSGSATLLARTSMDGLTPATMRAIRAGHHRALHAHGVELLVATRAAAAPQGVSP